jgi:hypothetical protein
VSAVAAALGARSASTDVLLEREELLDVRLSACEELLPSGGCRDEEAEEEKEEERGASNSSSCTTVRAFQADGACATIALSYVLLHVGKGSTSS